MCIRDSGVADEPWRRELHDDDTHRPGEQVTEQAPGASPSRRFQPALVAACRVCRVAHREVNVEVDRPLLAGQTSGPGLAAGIGGQVPGVAPVLLDEDDRVLLGIDIEGHGEFAGVRRCWARVESSGLLRGEGELVDLLEVVVPQGIQKDGVGVDGAEITVPTRRRLADRVAVGVGHSQSAAAKTPVGHACSFASGRTTTPTFSR